MQIKNFKRSKRKERNTYRRTPVRLKLDFSTETPQAQGERNDILKILKEQSCQSRFLSFINEREINTFPSK